MLRVLLMIGDRDGSAADGRTFVRLDPRTGEVASEAAAATIADAIAAAEVAARAFPAWAAMGPTRRRALLAAAADMIAARAEDFAEAMIAELGATPDWCEHDIAQAGAILREAAAQTTLIAGDIIPSDRPGMTSMAMRQPAGVVLGIAPWNAPVSLGTRAIAMALACGNCVILKASDLCPATHRLIGTALRDAGLPDGVVNVVTHASEDAGKVVETLISHAAVRRVSFTGSSRVGRLVAETAARYLKPIVLALGGKAALVVLDDADVTAAADAAVYGAFLNAGQHCLSTERIIVDETVADAFLDRFLRKVRALPAGDPRGEGVVLGPLVTAEASARVRGLIDDALAKGARLLAGGEAHGAVMHACVLDQVTPAMRVYSEEIFGPVVIVLRAKDVDEAVQLANDTDYGLSAAVFGRDATRAFAVACRIDSGVCHINSATVIEEPQAPFGGTKSSGFGRFGGKAAIEHFTELRWITIGQVRQSYPF